MTNNNDSNPNDIAIIGLSGRFPNCDSVDEYWAALRDGIECIHPLTDEQLSEAGVSQNFIANPNYVKAGGILKNMEYFDANFFGFSPKDAAILDPQHRHFYECSWEALENSGHAPDNFDGLIGVFAGSGPNSYFWNNVMTNPEIVQSVGYFLLRHTGNDRDFLPTGISYKFNLQGPSAAIQTACSTSLVAIHMACQSLLAGECDMALAGGVTISLPHYEGYMYRENEILSPDGHCRAFDAQSAGTVITSGVGVVILRRLEDALEDGDYIHAVIKGSAINNDGSRKIGYLAPSVDGHAEVVAEALAVSGLESEDISYIETHGTGTSVGDPIEIAALSEAFRRSSSKNQFCPIGSVKATIGHTDTAAGVAGLIKVVEALKNRQIPPSLNYSKPNPQIDFKNSPFYVNSELKDWDNDHQPRRAGISSLGVGGTNAHLIVEESPRVISSDPARDWELILLSAKSKKSLDKMAANLAEHLTRHPDLNLSDLAHTLQVGRTEFDYRRAIAASDIQSIKTRLDSQDNQSLITGKAPESEASIVFMFPGGGTQYPNMGRDLYENESVYRNAIDECLELLVPYIDFDLRKILFPSEENLSIAEEKLSDPTASICSIFITSYALARLWMDKGIEPDALTGHSLGEYVAACLSGVFSLSDALKIVALRGRVLKQTGQAVMLSVALPSEEVEKLLFDELDLSAVNGPDLCLVSGPEAQINKLSAELESSDVDYRRLKISAASHCRLLDPYLDEFRAGLQDVQFNSPTKKIISNVSGTWANPVEVTDPEYWVRHFRQPVKFHHGLREILRDSESVMLEMGPGSTLCSLVRQQVSKPRGIANALRHPLEEISDTEHFWNTIGRLWVVGVEIDWQSFREGEQRQRIPLPTYPFDRQKYWIEPGQTIHAEADLDNSRNLQKIEKVDDWFQSLMWKKSEIASDDHQPRHENLLYFTQKSEHSERVISRLRNSGHRVIVVHDGDRFFQIDEDHYIISSEAGQTSYDQLFQTLSERELIPTRILHDWLITENESFRPGSSFFHRNQERGFYSLTFLAKVLCGIDFQEPLHIDILSNGMQSVGDEKVLYPEKALVLGPVRVIPRELQNISIRSIDLDLNSTDQDPSADESSLDEIIKMIVRELELPDVNEIVAYRRGERLVERIEISGCEESTEPAFRDSGVYLITGGFGGIGQEVSKHLAKEYRAKIILLGRKELPPRINWDEWLREKHPKDSKSRLIRFVRELEQLGAEVLPISADVANIEQMRNVFETAEKTLGPINGIIHAAGIIDDSVIMSKSMESIDRVFTPKIHGTMVLRELTRSRDLDMTVLFSSTSALIGPAGQIDYTAANCFLNAFSQTEEATENNVIVIDWGVWKDVGAGRKVAERLKGNDIDDDFEHQLISHPVIDELLVKDEQKILFSTMLNSRDFWILDEHRTSNNEPIVPGTGYIEIIRAASNEVNPELKVEISDLSLFSPIVVGDGKEVEVRISFEAQDEQFFVQILSKSAQDTHSDWVVNASAAVRTNQSDDREALDLNLVRSRCETRFEYLNSQQHGNLKFGPRWDLISSVFYNSSEAIAELNLAEEFLKDLEHFELHPAILDMATGFAIPVFSQKISGNPLFVPLSYHSIRFYHPLEARVTSYIRLTTPMSDDSELMTFDILIANDQGKILVEIQDFSMKKILDVASLTNLQDNNPVAGPINLSDSEQSFLQTIENGILAREGIDCLERAISARPRNPVIISSIDVSEVIAQEDFLNRQTETSAMKFERPELDSEYEAPQDKFEFELANYWEELLGVDSIGINDDFFELGGHSLVAVRLFAKIKNKWDLEYPISILFQAPTISSFATLLRNEFGDSADQDDIELPKIGKSQFNLIVPMGDNQPSENPPFFLVAGMFGNVLNLRHLAAQIGSMQPVYAIQARGLHGDEIPHNRFEEMARDNINEIRMIQSQGPYYIGGFSGGGIVAFEMAHQLLEAGEEVGSLIMLDSIPATIPTANLADRFRIQWRKLKEGGLRYPVEWARNRWDWEMRRFRDDMPELTPAEFRSKEIEAAFIEACAHYVHKPYPGHIDLFKPQVEHKYMFGPQRILNEDREYQDEANHWRQYVSGSLEVHEVTGDHDSMVLEPHVRVLAAKLRSCLVRSFSGSDKSEPISLEEDEIAAAE